MEPRQIRQGIIRAFCLFEFRYGNSGLFSFPSGIRIRVPNGIQTAIQRNDTYLRAGSKSHVPSLLPSPLRYPDMTVLAV